MLKTVSSITNAIGALNYKGTWNASTNTPTLADGTGAKGDYYVVSTAGTQTFGGVQLFFGLGDWIVYNGAVWQRVEGGSDGNFANVTLTSTDAGATASPLLELYRDSASPAASDTLGEIEFNGEDSAGNKQAYGLIHASILSPTSTAEQGQLHFETATSGALTEKMIIGTSNLVINEIGGVFNVRIEGDTDANLFYTDATNSRVGVGTISPATKLDVNGSFNVAGAATISPANAAVAISPTGTGTVAISPAGALTINPTAVSTINNVAIGGTTPLAGKFTTLEATGVTTVQAGSAAAPALTTTGDTNTGIFFPAADTIAFTEGGAEIVRLDNAGNLLVGTTSANGPGGASIVGRLFKTVAGTGTVNNASSNTLFAIGTVNAYLVTAQTGNASGLSTTALVHYAPGGNPPVSTNLVQDNVNFAITLSGNNVQITNNLGGGVGYDFSAIRIY